MLHPKWQQQVANRVSKGREGEGQKQRGCHKQEHRTHIKAAGAEAGTEEGAGAAAAAVAFNVYFACQGT